MTTLAHIIDAMMVSDSPADTGSFGRVAIPLPADSLPRLARKTMASST